MKRYRIQILDPDTGELVHTCTHCVCAETQGRAVWRFAQVYGFKNTWKLRAIRDH